MNKYSANVQDEHPWYATPVQSGLGSIQGLIEKLMSKLPSKEHPEYGSDNFWKEDRKEKRLSHEELKELVKKLTDKDKDLKDLNIYSGPMRMRDHYKEMGLKGALLHPILAGLGAGKVDHYRPEVRDGKAKGYINIYHKTPSSVAHELAHAKDHASFPDPELWKDPMSTREYYTSKDAIKNLKKVNPQDDHRQTRNVLLAALDSYAYGNETTPGHEIDKDIISKHWEKKDMKKSALNAAPIAGDAVETLARIIANKAQTQPAVQQDTNQSPNDKMKVAEIFDKFPDNNPFSNLNFEDVIKPKEEKKHEVPKVTQAPSTHSTTPMNSSPKAVHPAMRKTIFKKIMDHKIPSHMRKYPGRYALGATGIGLAGAGAYAAYSNRKHKLEDQE